MPKTTPIRGPQQTAAAYIRQLREIAKDLDQRADNLHRHACDLRQEADALCSGGRIAAQPFRPVVTAGRARRPATAPVAFRVRRGKLLK
jgi:hypothetical protein